MIPMSSQDEEFLRTLRAAFQVEAGEHLQAMTTGLLELEKDPAASFPADTLERVYREAHSLKGAARAVNLTQVETMCQSLESVFAAWKRQELKPSPELFDTLQGGLDLVAKLLASPEAADPRDISELLSRNTQFAAGGPGGPAVAEPAAMTPVAAAEKPPVADSVRIGTAKLDTLILEAQEMLAIKLTAAQRAADLREIRAVFEPWKKEWAKVAPALRKSVAQTLDATAHPLQPVLDGFLTWNLACMKSLEGRITALLRAAEQDSHTIDNLVTDLVNDSKRLLMLPFSTLLGAFPKLVRDLCRDQGKEAELVIHGGEVEIDKRILEEMKDPLIHLLRNCIDHGVEKPEERKRCGKPPRAVLSVAVAQVEGNKVEIMVSDDGAGIDAAKVRAAALQQNILSEADARNLTEADTLPLIFRSGVSTSPALTEISGRGLGLAIVREKTEKLGGRVSVETVPSRGTTFRILLPLTLATFRGIFVQAAGQTFVVPTASVERVIRIKPDDIKTVEHRETILLDARPVSLVRLADILELPVSTREAESPALLPALVLGSGDQRIAFSLDDVLREDEVLVKPLAKPLLRVRNIAGATVLGSGRAVPILNVADLLKSAIRSGGTPSRPVPVPPVPAKKKRILVVEDSITSRLLLKSILETAGYHVKTAVDGADAFARLHEEEFDLIVTDVQMPRMNGLDLTARIRHDPKLADKPVILVTALATPEDRARGADAGASAYIVKSNFDQSDLLETIRRLE